MKKREYFPLYIKSSGKNAVVIGGGNIALRRINTLLNFNFNITLIARSVKEEIYKLSDSVNIIIDEYNPKYLDGAYIVLACTNDGKINKQIEEDAKRNNIYVSVCDNSEGCSFYFPGIVLDNDATIGIAGSGKDHKAVKKVINRVRNIFEGD